MMNVVTRVNDIASSLAGEIGQLKNNAKGHKNYFTRGRPYWFGIQIGDTTYLHGYPESENLVVR